MPNEKRRFTDKDVMGHWTHSHEEDPTDSPLVHVYRPRNWTYGPSRGRASFDLQAKTKGRFWDIAPADGRAECTVSWRLESGAELVIRWPDGRLRRWRIEDAEPNRLVLRELLGTA